MVETSVTRERTASTRHAPARACSIVLTLTFASATACSSENTESRVAASVPSGTHKSSSARRADSLTDTLEAFQKAERTQESTDHQSQQTGEILVLDNETQEVIDLIEQETTPQNLDPASSASYVLGNDSVTSYPDLVTVFQTTTAQGSLSFSLNGSTAGSVPIFQMFPTTGPDRSPIYHCINSHTNESFFDNTSDCSDHTAAHSEPFGWIFNSPPDGINYEVLYICGFESSQQAAYPGYHCSNNLATPDNILGYVYPSGI